MKMGPRKHGQGQHSDGPTAGGARWLADVEHSIRRVESVLIALSIVAIAAGGAVQQHLLEQHRPPAGPLDVAARTYPAKVVGGDYYDFIPLDGGRLAVVVADVAGKGLPAALIMPAVKIALRTLASRRR
jgi:serine phosphatase RsbU (regulator of sigma subunit)